MTSRHRVPAVPADSLRTLLMKRAAFWKDALERARRLSHARDVEVQEAATAVEDYRLLARDLATARRLAPESRAREYLESAYSQSHATLHRPAVRPLAALWNLLRNDVPEVVASLRPHIAWVSVLFVLAIASGYWLVHTYPQLIGLFASPQLIATVERGGLWTEGLLNVVPSSVLSLQILTNNVVVSLFAWSAGVLFGLGTFYIVALNGLMLGAVFAFTAQHRLADDLFRFIVAHGTVELSVLVLSGAAGAAVGEALVRPQLASRGASFRVAALRSGKLLFAGVLLLIGCGFIEGYVSADPDVPLSARVAVGAAYWLVMLA
ncbi:MAG TPA: stage II sporulation protein M, partial [Steroidobacteraceae bacterium]|nr:stage II sporulation protein M [Steroidobacteraceae bacterium]